MPASPAVEHSAGDASSSSRQDGSGRPAETNASRLLIVVLRLAGAVLLLANGWVHWHLYREGYSSIKTIGPLFLVDAIAALVMAIVVLVAPRKLLALVALGGALLQFGTVAGLVITTEHGLFGFTESTKAEYYWDSIILESIGGVVLLVLAGYAARQLRSRIDTARW